MHFDNGGSLVKFPIATSETYTNREGQRVTNTEWHNMVVINAKGLVDVAHKYLKKDIKSTLKDASRHANGKTKQVRIDTQQKSKQIK